MQSLNKSKLIKDPETQYESGMQFRDKWWGHLGSPGQHEEAGTSLGRPGRLFQKHFVGPEVEG